MFTKTSSEGAVQNKKKQATAEAVLDYIKPGCVLGVGTGSTVNHLIDLLPSVASKIDTVVASSEATANRLKALNFDVVELNTVNGLDLYIDGADEVNRHKQMIKGGGGALTGEKILASAAKQFICIVDDTKYVDLLGSFPVPLEVIPMARSLIARQLVQLGVDPVYRQGFVSDYGNMILDVYNLTIDEPIKWEQTLSSLPGVVTCGIFAKNPANIVLIGSSEGVKRL